MLGVAVAPVRRGLFAPLVEPAHLSGPVRGAGVCHHVVESRYQVRKRSVLLIGKHDAVVLWIFSDQSHKIGDVEREDAAPLGGGSQ